ncbi:MAG: hypothetical protein H6Q99_854 [Proteobacteria bacterium]|nr:hypothetical protein [Pseudomonadota bacterium]
MVQWSEYKQREEIGTILKHLPTRLNPLVASECTGVVFSSHRFSIGLFQPDRRVL